MTQEEKARGRPCDLEENAQPDPLRLFPANLER